MKVYFLRHGIAVEPDEWRGRDFDRPLTRAGIERMEREARAIEGLSLGLDVIVTSPLLRAKQTAEIVAARLKLRDGVVEDERLAGGFDVDRCRALLADHADADAVMLVGHEPNFSITVGGLIGDASVEVKKGAIAGVEFAGSASRRGMLIALIPPKLLAALGR